MVMEMVQVIKFLLVILIKRMHVINEQHRAFSKVLKKRSVPNY
jgi:hypothetical protein